MTGAYYNEFDPFAVAWLRELINAHLIADGDVDERSITDVRPEDLAGFTQCHFFAGIGGWSYALRLAGWPDIRPVWTGSCPCQPFSSAGYSERDGLVPLQGNSGGAESNRAPSDALSRSAWDRVVWLPCRDDKSRPVEPLVEPLVDGLSDQLGCVRLASGETILAPLIEGGLNRVGRLRGYGNAICPEVAALFIRAYRDSVD